MRTANNEHGGTAAKRPMDAAAADAGMDGSSKQHPRDRRPHPLGRRPTTAGAHEPLGKPATRTAGFPPRPQAQLAQRAQQR